MVPDNGGYHYVWYAGKNHDQSSNICGRPVEISEKENDFFDKIINKEGEEAILTLDDENGEPYFVACSPVLDKNKDVAAVAVVNLSNSIINDSLKRLIKDMNKFIAVFMIIIFSFIYISTNIGIVRPVKRLTKAASELVDDIESGREFSVDIHTNDEIEVLADAFLNMDADLRKYIKENNEITTERERMNAELNMASSIQSSSLPNVFPPFPNRKEFDIFALMEPAKMVGGDFYDFFFTLAEHVAKAKFEVE